MISEDAAAWAIRLFLGREPTDDTELQFHRNHADLESVRRGFADTHEFRAFYQSAVEGGGPRTYTAPLFLLRRPDDSAIRSKFEEPTLANPVSQLCTEAQFAEPAFFEWCAALGIPASPHRKIWEFCYVMAAMRAAGVLQPGSRALGFGTGTEPIPSLLAKLGLHVVASDAPPDIIAGQGWDTTNQHTGALMDLHRPGIIDRETFLERVQFTHVDMNAIPAELNGFDACWSSCCFEHLGSIKHGLDFVQNSLATLRPGGVAVHTTEFNLQSNGATVESPGLSLFRKRDIEALLGRLVAAGHDAWPLNLHPGTGAVDAVIDVPPYALPHLKLEVAATVTTSIGLIVRKRLA